ncbi:MULTISPECIES: hypothetical protein [Rhodococcus]|uniref:Uncharacterized protein n=1 Tax=Rhodococcus aetherivorans TaxID=191292 RepID=A0AA46PRQ0_9NOCA|nr:MULTISPECIES: hypothetical protein [Rhodococcus]MBC2587601.1 hypothetical protein [Rhodococcus aetherivorans]MDV6292071.1 hypothetical protein [Rhodococcus aetherivorans]QRI74334.1 hypothetical protein JQ505_17150 [Rhodococcus aetherivorans]QSE57744.1 hypothetical protein JYA75_18260 [Rhodococcus sp. PSBB066]QSE70923.1 hypothetical protein JYA91_09330 [Rhodococcus sp. PSBB049]
MAFDPAPRHPDPVAERDHTGAVASTTADTEHGEGTYLDPTGTDADAAEASAVLADAGTVLRVH